MIGEMGSGNVECSILIVEDEMLLALMLEDLLSESGYHVMRAIGLKDGHEVVDRMRVDAAILDVSLGGVEVFPLAIRLQESQIPFVFATAGDAARIGARFGGYPIISKPYTIEQIRQSLTGLLGPASRSALH